MAETNQNSIQVIFPYWKYGTWVFDDKAKGLDAEPFVSGAPEFLSLIADDIVDAKDGFRLLFSGRPFPGYQIAVDWDRKEGDGNWYKSDELGLEGWLCPALFKYFSKAPPKIYAKGEAKG
jgi:hypothetical protein